MKPSEWLIQFFKSRNLDKSDGRSLFKYRMSAEEYNDLRMSLRTNTPNNDSIQNWDVCFVFFAAEWWSRNYSGEWRWKDILKDIDLQIDSTSRGKLADSGLKKLGRKVYVDRSGDNEFLGTIAIEAGIPTRTLEKNGWLSKLIRSSYEDYVNLSSSTSLFIASIENHVSRLNVPETFRKDAFYKLVEVIVTELSALKKKYSLGKQDEPITFLDSVDSSWRDNFPISIESNGGVSFLNELLTEIAQIKEKQKYPLSMDRILHQNGKEWRIDIVLNFPQGETYLEDLRIQDENIVGKIESSSRLAILLVSDEGLIKELGITIPGRKSDGRCVVEFPRGVVVKNIEYSSSYKIVLTSQGTDIAVLPLAQALNKDVPWSFIKNEGKYILKAQSSFNSSSDEVITVIPYDYEIVEGQPEPLGNFENWGSVYRIWNKTIFKGLDKGVFKIDVKNNQIESFNYVLRGNNYLPAYIKTNRANVFYGKPLLIKEDTESGLTSNISTGIQVRPRGPSDWQDKVNISSGQYGIRLIENGFTLFQEQIFVLSDQFEIRLLGNSHNPKIGNVEILNSTDFNLTVIKGDFSSTPKINEPNKGFDIQLTALQDAPPETFEIKLSKPNGSELCLTIPFPSAGAQIFRNGFPIAKSEVFFYSQLYGIRLKLYNNPNQNARFRIALKAESNEVDTTDLFYEREIVIQDKYVTEVSLIGLREEMDMLFGSVPDLDKSLLLDVKTTNGQSLISKRVKLYSNQFKAESLTGLLIPDLIQNTPIEFLVSAFRLDVSNEGNVPVSIFYERSSGNLSWQPKNWDIIGKEGIWFLYPPIDSVFAFRPFVAKPGELEYHENSLNSLTEVARVREFNKRRELLTDYVNRFAFEYDNPDWNEIDWLWKHTSHLPMASLDVWRAFSESEKGIIALFLKTEWDSGLFIKFLTEFPILLESINVQNWYNGLMAYMAYWEGKVDLQTINFLLLNKINNAEEKLKILGLKRIINNELIQGKDYHKKVKSVFDKNEASLHRENTSLREGDSLREELIQHMEDLPDAVKNAIPSINRDKFKPIVYLPFVLAYKSINSNAYPPVITSSFVYKISKLISLNQEWFRDVFTFTQLFIWSEKNKKV